MCREAALTVEAQVPFSHHVGGVTGLLKALRERGYGQWDATRLTGTDDGVLEACVDLIPAQKNRSLLLVC